MQVDPVKDGWNRKKVQRDVLETARLQKFTSEQVGDWKALFEFHERYTTPESLPNLPYTVQIEDGRSYKMEGPPEWDELWRVLRRFPRPHRTAAEEPAAATARAAATAATAEREQRAAAAKAAAGSAATQQLSQAEKTAALNRVGGKNHPAAQHKAAAAHTKMLDEMLARGRNLKSVELNKLYFCGLTESEGELLVGIAVPRAVDKDGNFSCEWFTRAKWASERSHKDYNWQTNPIFIPCLRKEELEPEMGQKRKRARKGGKKFKQVVVSSVEPLSEFIPIKVCVF